MYELNFPGGVEQVWRMAQNGHMVYVVFSRVFIDI